jgi:hypothetical protein
MDFLVNFRFGAYPFPMAAGCVTETHPSFG